MIQKIKSYLLVAVMGLTLATPALLPGTAQAAQCNLIAHGVQSGSNFATGANTGCDDPNNTGGTGIQAAARSITNIFSVIVGIVAVLMLIYGGFRYITSGGDSGRVGNAKNTLIYAIVGLVVVALAQIIVHFVLQGTSQFVT